MWVPNKNSQFVPHDNAIFSGISLNYHMQASIRSYNISTHEYIYYSTGILHPTSVTHGTIHLAFKLQNSMRS